MTHDVAHLLIFSGYLAAMVLVPLAFKQLIRLRWQTVVAGSGFFLFCGLTHVGLVIGQSSSTWVVVNDHLQAVAILAFVPLLAGDLNAAKTRLLAVKGSLEALHDIVQSEQRNLKSNF